MTQQTITDAPVFEVAQDGQQGNGYVAIAILSGLALMDPEYPALVDQFGGDPRAILTYLGLAHLYDMTPGQETLFRQTSANAELRAVLGYHWWPAYRSERSAGRVAEIDAAWEPLKEVEDVK